MTQFKDVLKEPLIHFLLLGALIFAVYAGVGSTGTETSDTRLEVVVTQAQIDGMVAQFENTWRRAPNATERAGIIDAHVRQDILVQEALALSMDENDPVIRQRLAQKMEFLVSSAANAQPPTHAQLETFFQENAATYASKDLIAIEQIFLGEDPSEDTAQKTIEAANNGVDIASLGQRTVLPTQLRLSDRNAVTQTFGVDLFDSLADLEPGVWTGPFRSGFGVHAIRLLEYVPPVLPDLEDLRDQVEADWVLKTSDDLSAALFAEMREHYTIILPQEISDPETAK